MDNTENKDIETQVETDVEETAGAAEAEETAVNETAQDAAKETEKDPETNEQTGEEAPEEASGDPKEKKDKKIFGRKKEKKDKKDEKIEELTDRLTRQLAEFDNYRKRTEKEKSANYMVGARDVIEKILPVVDNFERGLASADPADPFADGMNKVYKQFIQILADMGVTPIEAVGKEFDPNLHNAVMKCEDESLGENIVAEEFQKGYMYKDQVVRYSMVKVAN